MQRVLSSLSASPLLLGVILTACLWFATDGVVTSPRRSKGALITPGMPVSTDASAPPPPAPLERSGVDAPCGGRQRSKVVISLHRRGVTGPEQLLIAPRIHPSLFSWVPVHAEANLLASRVVAQVRQLLEHDAPNCALVVMVNSTDAYDAVRSAVVTQVPSHVAGNVAVNLFSVSTGVAECDDVARHLTNVHFAERLFAFARVIFLPARTVTCFDGAEAEVEGDIGAGRSPPTVAGGCLPFRPRAGGGISPRSVVVSPLDGGWLSRDAYRELSRLVDWYFIDPTLCSFAGQFAAVLGDWLATREGAGKAPRMRPCDVPSVRVLHGPWLPPPATPGAETARGLPLAMPARRAQVLLVVIVDVPGAWGSCPMCVADTVASFLTLSPNSAVVVTCSGTSLLDAVQVAVWRLLSTYWEPRLRARLCEHAESTPSYACVQEALSHAATWYDFRGVFIATPEMVQVAGGIETLSSAGSVPAAAWAPGRAGVGWLLRRDVAEHTFGGRAAAGTNHSVLWDDAAARARQRGIADAALVVTADAAFPRPPQPHDSLGEVTAQLLTLLASGGNYSGVDAGDGAWWWRTLAGPCTASERLVPLCGGPRRVLFGAERQADGALRTASRFMRLNAASVRLMDRNAGTEAVWCDIASLDGCGVDRAALFKAHSNPRGHSICQSTRPLVRNGSDFADAGPLAVAAGARESVDVIVSVSAHSCAECVIDQAVVFRRRCPRCRMVVALRAPMVARVAELLAAQVGLDGAHSLPLNRYLAVNPRVLARPYGLVMATHLLNVRFAARIFDFQRVVFVGSNEMPFRSNLSQYLMAHAGLNVQDSSLEQASWMSTERQYGDLYSGGILPRFSTLAASFVYGAGSFFFPWHSSRVHAPRGALGRPAASSFIASWILPPEYTWCDQVLLQAYARLNVTMFATSPTDFEGQWLTASEAIAVANAMDFDVQWPVAQHKDWLTEHFFLPAILWQRRLQNIVDESRPRDWHASLAASRARGQKTTFFTFGQAFNPKARVFPDGISLNDFSSVSAHAPSNFFTIKRISRVATDPVRNLLRNQT